MAIPKATKAQPKKPKTKWEKLKGSALFLLLMVIGFSVAVVYLIIAISRLLSEGKFPWDWAEPFLGL